MSEHRARLDSELDAVIEAGMSPTRDNMLRETLDAADLEGKTLVWSLTDVHAERPYRACVLIEDDGTPHLAEITAGPNGRPEGRIERLTMERWSELSALAYWRLLDTEDERYEPAVENSSKLATVLQFDEQIDKTPSSGNPVVDAVIEVAELRVFGNGPAIH